MMDDQPPTIEEFLERWSRQGATAVVTDDQRGFISTMRAFRDRGIGYGWMMQMIELEWEHHSPGSSISTLVRAERDEARAIARELAEAGAQVFGEWEWQWIEPVYPSVDPRPEDVEHFEAFGSTKRWANAYRRARDAGML